jgi:hypothetical protein
MIEVKAEEFGDYYKRISKVDDEVRKALRRRLTAAAKPVVQEVKQAARSIPSKGGEVSKKRRKSKDELIGLRASLALASTADFKSSSKGGVLKIRVSRSKFEAASGRPNTLAYYMDGRRKRAWKHPVFEKTSGPIVGGNAENWVTQESHPFLGVTIIKHRETYAKEVSSAVIDALKECKIPLT